VGKKETASIQNVAMTEQQGGCLCDKETNEDKHSLVSLELSQCNLAVVTKQYTV